MDNIQTEEPVLITGLNIEQEDFDYSMTELAELAQANHMKVIDRIDQSIDRPNPATYFGSGKVDEIKEAVLAENISTVITNDAVSYTHLTLPTN